MTRFNIDRYNKEERGDFVHLCLKDEFKNPDIKVRIFSFAKLDDQKGIKYNIEFMGDLKYKWCLSAMNYFKVDHFCQFYNIKTDKIDIKEEFFTPYTFDHLLEKGYYVRFYHFCVALDYMSFQLESKGICGSYMNWSDKHTGYRVKQITTTGDHMWNDGKGFRCLNADKGCCCFSCFVDY